MKTIFVWTDVDILGITPVWALMWIWYYPGLDFDVDMV